MLIFIYFLIKSVLFFNLILRFNIKNKLLKITICVILVFKKYYFLFI